jgi:glycosyltransferase involved in cell wall biosynthesis
MSAIDIVIPCYNYARFLRPCVESVLTQTGVHLRILIIDDASSDNTPEVGGELAGRDARIALRRNTKNKGLIATANEGIMDWATAKYSLLLSADDALTPGALERAVKVMDQHSDVGMVYGMASIISGDDSGMMDFPESASFKYRIVPGVQFLKQVCEHWAGVPTPTAVHRTELQHRIGGYLPGLPRTSDVEMWMRIATQANIAVIHTLQGYYRWHSSNMSLDYTDRALSDLDEQYKTIDEVYRSWGSHLEEFASWIDMAKLRLARQACWMAGVAFDRGDIEGASTCLNFAKEVYPLRWRLTSWWKAQVKSIAGPALTGVLKRLVRGSNANLGTVSFAPYIPGEIFGWWPEAQEFTAVTGSQKAALAGARGKPDENR